MSGEGLPRKKWPGYYQVERIVSEKEWLLEAHAQELFWLHYREQLRWDEASIEARRPFFHLARRLQYRV